MIVRDGFVIQAPQPPVVAYNGVAIPLSPAETAMFRELAMRDDFMSAGDMMETYDSDGFNEVALVCVARIRAKLKSVGAPDPIISRIGRIGGYKWGLAT